MRRFRICNLRALRAGIAAGALAWCATAHAQVTGAIQDPLTPPSDSEQKLPYRKFKPVAPQAQLGPPPNFTPPPSGAGSTGFDATNARKKQKPKTKQPTPKANVAAPHVPLETNPAPAKPQDSAPVVSSAAAGSFASGAPGQPPVALTPVYTQPKRRKAHTEPPDPYAAIGMRAGTFLLYPAIELSIGRDSNPSQSPGGRGATTYTAAPELKVQSDWARHELKADLRGTYTAYSPDETPSLSRPYFNGKVDGRIDVTKNDKIELGVRDLVSTDNPNSPNLQAGLSKLPIYTTFGGYGGYTHRFNRLELGVKGDAERTVYQDSKLIDGTSASNEDRNYNQYGGTFRAGYELYPGMTPFVEVGGDTRKHDLATDFFGFQRDSNGFTAKIGSTFEMRQFLTGEVAIGYTKRDYADSRLAPLSGLIGNGSLIWTATPLTTVKFTAASTIAESTTPDVSGIFYRDVGVQVDHEFRRWLVGTLKAGFGYDTYVGGTVPLTAGGTTELCSCVASTATTTTPDRKDKRYSLGAGLTYKLNRMVQIKGEFRQEWLRSNVSGVDYTASIFLLGLRLQY
ncbi:MAG: outer membrane beta-barrel protein [Pseudolabrys sp.]|nr:outer membrane beta-barrel protein [Pseudolabrys sp.]MBV9261114.1 outer membrane beta-barrel protein [Pseudolabrys sp.]